ncbi:MAG: hypothetical protein NVS4B3_10830 [Gemmatimonadaceae bacterium]
MACQLNVVEQQLKLWPALNPEPNDSGPSETWECTDSAEVKRRRRVATRHIVDRIRHPVKGVSIEMAKELQRKVEALRRHPRRVGCDSAKRSTRGMDRRAVGRRQVNREKGVHRRRHP